MEKDNIIIIHIPKAAEDTKGTMDGSIELSGEWRNRTREVLQRVRMAPTTNGVGSTSWPSRRSKDASRQNQGPVTTATPL